MSHESGESVRIPHFESLIKWGRFKQWAKDAKACYKVKQLVLVNLEIIDEYLEAFHIVDDDFYK